MPIEKRADETRDEFVSRCVSKEMDAGMSQEQAEENFQKIVENDKLKDDFCKNNGYKMVRISYKDYPNILSILHGELLDIMDNVG